MSHSRDEIIVRSTWLPAELLTPAARHITVFYANAVVCKSQMNYSWFSDLIKINAWLHKVLDGWGDCIYYANKAETRSCGVARWGASAAFLWSTVGNSKRTHVTLKVTQGPDSSVMLLFHCFKCMWWQTQFQRWAENWRVIRIQNFYKKQRRLQMQSPTFKEKGQNMKNRSSKNCKNTFFQMFWG